MPNYESAECFYHRNTIQNPTHLVLECSEYRVDRVEAFEGLDNNQKSIKYLLNTKISREKLFKFLEKIKIASKNGYCKVIKTFSFISQIGISYFLISWLKEATGQLDGDIGGKKIENQQAYCM